MLIAFYFIVIKFYFTKKGDKNRLELLEFFAVVYYREYYMRMRVRHYHTIILNRMQKKIVVKLLYFYLYACYCAQEIPGVL